MTFQELSVPFSTFSKVFFFFFLNEAEEEAESLGGWLTL